MLFWALRRLRSGDRRIRLKAIAELASARESRAVHALLDLLYEGDGEIRRAAVDALVEIGDLRAVASMLLPSDEHRRAIEPGASPRDFLTELDQMEIRLRAIERVGASKLSGAADALLSLLPATSESEVLRRAALEALVTLGERRTIPAAVEAGLDYELLEKQLRVLDPRWASSPEVCALVPALIERLSRGNDDAARALGAIGDDRCTPALVSALLHAWPDPWLDIKAKDAVAAALEYRGWTPRDDAEALAYTLARRDFREAARFGEKGLSALLVLFERLQCSIPVGLIEALGAVGDTRAVRPLLRLIDSPDRSASQAAMKALQQLEARGVAEGVARKENRPTTKRLLALLGASDARHFDSAYFGHPMVGCVDYVETDRSYQCDGCDAWGPYYRWYDNGSEWSESRRYYFCVSCRKVSYDLD